MIEFPKIHRTIAKYKILIKLYCILPKEIKVIFKSYQNTQLSGVETKNLEDNPICKAIILQLKINFKYIYIK